MSEREHGIVRISIDDGDWVVVVPYAYGPGWVSKSDLDLGQAIDEAARKMKESLMLHAAQNLKRDE